MLKLTIEIVPHGDESKCELLETVQVVNTGKHPNSPERGEYIIYHGGGNFKIDNHNRSEGYWPLIRAIADRLSPVTKTKNQFKPDYIVPPGETIKEYLKNIGMSQTGLAVLMDITPARMGAIIEGSTEITQDIAARLSDALGMPAQFWLNLTGKDDAVKRKCISCNHTGIDKGRAFDGRRAYRCQKCGRIWTEGMQGREKKFNPQRQRFQFERNVRL